MACLFAPGATALAQTSASHDAPLACRSLQASDLAGLDYDISQPNGNALKLTPAQSGAPSAVQVQMCFFYTGSARLLSVNVIVERYADANGVREWLDENNRRAMEKSARIEQIGDVTCEHGETLDRIDGTVRKLRYLACDQLIGAQRIGIGFERSGDDIALPTPARAAQIVERLVARIGKPSVAL